MRYAIFGDIHSNFEALNRAVATAKKHRADQFLSVGDIVGYGPEPEACLDLLDKHSFKAVAGNHDRAVAGLLDFSQYTGGAYAGIVWTQENLASQYVATLKELPVTLDNEDFTIVHASLDHPLEWDYVLDRGKAAASMHKQKTQVCFYGHTHLPLIFRSDGDVQRFLSDPVKLLPHHKYMINVGSVGQPRDGNPHACLLIYDTAVQMIQLHRFEYNVEKTQAKILQEGLPASLAMRLGYGR